MLRAVRNILHGTLPSEFSNIADAQGWWRKLPFALLFVTLLIFGVWPRMLTDKIQPAAQRIVTMANAGSTSAPSAVTTTNVVVSAQSPFQTQ